jgi:hypothetical protein
MYVSRSGLALISLHRGILVGILVGSGDALTSRAALELLAAASGVELPEVVAPRRISRILAGSEKLDVDVPAQRTSCHEPRRTSASLKHASASGRGTVCP